MDMEEITPLKGGGNVVGGVRIKRTQATSKVFFAGVNVNRLIRIVVASETEINNQFSLFFELLGWLLRI